MNRGWIWIVLAVAACGGSPKSPAPAPAPAPAATSAPAPSDCRTTLTAAVERRASHSLDGVPPDQRSQEEAAMKQVVPKLEQALISSCTADQWAPAVLSCMNAATTAPEMDRCGEQLTPEQQAHVRQAVEAATKDVPMHQELTDGPAPAPAPAP